MITLKTSRLIVRPPTVEDAAAIADYYRRNRSFHRPWDPTRPEDFFTEEFWGKHIIELLEEQQIRQQLDLFLFKKDVAESVVGKITFSGIVRGALQACFLGYALDADEEGKGLMSEALRVGIDHMFEVENLHRIMANYVVPNTRSAALLKRLGFQIEGVAKDYLRIDGRWQDHVLTSLTNLQWKER